MARQAQSVLQQTGHANNGPHLHGSPRVSRLLSWVFGNVVLTETGM
jgi:hypothetical protein